MAMQPVGIHNERHPHFFLDSISILSDSMLKYAEIVIS